MTTTSEQIETTLRGFFERDRPDVVAAWLYGSVGRGAHGPASDVDVAILRGRSSQGTLEDLPLDLEAALESVLGRAVSVIVADDAPPDLVHRVLRDGRLLVDRDPGRRIRFEVQTRNEYFDLVPYLNRYRRRS